MSSSNYALCEECGKKCVYVGESDGEEVYCPGCYNKMKDQVKQYHDQMHAMSEEYKKTIEKYKKTIEHLLRDCVAIDKHSTHLKIQDTIGFKKAKELFDE